MRSIQVHVGYKKPRAYALTPSRKHIVKAVARKSKQAVAMECMKDSVTRRHVLRRVGMVMQSELITMCRDSSNSILRSQSSSEMCSFTWEKLLSELEVKAPSFLSIIRAVMKTKQPRENQNSIIGMCAAMLLKHRLGSMSLVRRILSLILYAGRSQKQVLFLVHEWVCFANVHSHVLIRPP